MKKLTKLVAAAVICMGFSLNSNAQFSLENLDLGGGIGFQRYGSLGAPLNINIRGHYRIDEKNVVVVSYHYNLPKTISSDKVPAINMTNPLDIITVNEDIKATFQNINLDFQRYFVGDLDEDFGMYGLAGVGITLAGVSYEYGSYNSSVYSLSKGTDESYSGPIINVGLGGSYLVADRLRLYGELRLGLPANSTSANAGGAGTSTAIDNPIPYHIGFMLGVNYSLFQ